MLRTLLTVPRKAFTCLFIPSAKQVVNVPRQHIHRSCILRDLDKDVLHKNTLLEQQKKEEEMHAVEDMEISVDQFRQNQVFPTLETHSMMIGGVQYDELPIVHIKATQNNTILSLTKYSGDVIMSESAGTVGFKNASRGTNIAAQTAAVQVGQKSVDLGYNTIRVCIKGIGPGRLAAVKGLQMAGVTIVSLTDITPIPHNGNRPRKKRRL